MTFCRKKPYVLTRWRRFLQNFGRVTLVVLLAATGTFVYSESHMHPQITTRKQHLAITQPTARCQKLIPSQSHRRTLIRVINCQLTLPSRLLSFLDPAGARPRSSKILTQRSSTSLSSPHATTSSSPRSCLPLPSELLSRGALFNRRGTLPVTKKGGLPCTRLKHGRWTL